MLNIAFLGTFQLPHKPIRSVMKIARSSYPIFSLVLCALFFLPTAIHAQHNNSISFEASSRFFPNLDYSHYPELYIGDQFGVFYERKVAKRQSISVGFTKWNNFIQNGIRKDATIVEWGNYDSWQMGKIAYRRNYKMIDVSYKYTVRMGRKSEIKAGLGLSCSFGSNTYFDSFSNLPNTYQIYQHDKTEAYLGVVPMVSYDHYLFRGRLSIGADLLCRKYLGMFATQIDYGVHLGCNF